MSGSNRDNHDWGSNGRQSIFSAMMRFFLEQKLIVFVFLAVVTLYGMMVAPFDWNISWLSRDPVPVDAIPDIGENQQIVFTDWEGRSPRDIEDQITYPLTISLLGVPGVKQIRSSSNFGFSTIFVIFHDDVEFYWSRSRILEKLNSLPAGTLPEGAQPFLGPDATALGQVFWYTLEGEGFGLQDLRTLQDWYVRYYLQSAEGVSEVASVGGYVKEYQVDIDPDAMRAHGIVLPQVIEAIRKSNVDVGARTIEMNRAEYVVRGLGFIRSVEDIEQTVLKASNNVPLTIDQIGKVSLGPALRRGALDKEGAEVVGGVVTVRYGENPLRVIKNVKAKIEEIAPGLPTKRLEDGRTSQVKIVPFYDRTGLINETLETLRRALTEEILVTIIVVIVMVNHMASSTLISGLLPLAVLMTFIGMKHSGVDANIMALSGIAIAIGTMVDMGTILCENILRHLREASPDERKIDVIHRAGVEVGGAIVTAVSTTVISFLPVFTLTGPEGKLFKPVAYTKTYALIASLIVALVAIPPLAHLLFTKWRIKSRTRLGLNILLLIVAGLIGQAYSWWIGGALALVPIHNLLVWAVPGVTREASSFVMNIVVLAGIVYVLTIHWLPLGPAPGTLRNLAFVGALVFGLLALMKIFQWTYGPLLRWCLDNKGTFLIFPIGVILIGFSIWLGFSDVFGIVPRAYDVIVPRGEPRVEAQHRHGSETKTDAAPKPVYTGDNPIRNSDLWQRLDRRFPGLGKEFMPDLDEGSFLFMPTTMPHASIGESLDIVQKQDKAIRAVPEVKSVVGKIGRTESALDPAPISMIETVVTYVPEYKTDPKTGKRIVDEETGAPIRNWRPHIRTPDDIWEEITEAAAIPGTTSAPKLQPIAARIVMLQSGMRAPMGVKVRAKSLEELERIGMDIERYLKQVPSIEPDTVTADRVVAKPYIEIDIDRRAIARYGVNIRDVQDVIETAIGGRRITTTVEGRERYPVRVRYFRELRDSVEALENILVPGAGGVQVPMSQVAEIRFVRGPMAIKSEDSFLVSYVLFDKKPETAEVGVVEEARAHLNYRIKTGDLTLPAGASFTFAGSYENQVRSEKTLMVVVPLALVVILVILYFQFRSAAVSMLIFSGILTAWAGGFIMLWLYAQPWFMDFSVFGVNLRELFQIRPYNLSVAVWVGFLALFGIASDDGVIFSTYLDQVFQRRAPDTVEQIRDATVEAGLKRIRPALMTSATTILALVPVITSTGRGSDVMVPMALPVFGGMTVVLVTVFIVPVLYCLVKEAALKATMTGQ